MPIFMDVHIVPGVKAKDVAEAHRKDLLHQEEHGCNCMTYWIDEQRESIFCLIEAPDKSSVEEMHSKAHGLIPSKIIEVNSSVVESFLGRIYDPESVQANDEGLRVFADPSLRVLLVTRTTDPILLQSKLGKEKATELLNHLNQVIRKGIAANGGREVEHEGFGFIISFNTAAKAFNCALEIRNELSVADIRNTGLKLALNAGEPVNKSDNLFGDTIKLADHMCFITGEAQLAISSSAKELLSNDLLQKKKNILDLSPKDEALLESLFQKLDENWQDSAFNVPDYCNAMAMSKSQLYRKTLELSGLSPNQLLKDYRLEKAKDLMKKQRYSISQITFESGFTSPSYFTKCFKSKYGLLPMAYLDLLH